MKLNLLTTLFLLFTFTFVFAQKEVKVEGTVVEEGSNIPLEYATITFKTKPDNKIITGGITDSKGKFSVEVPAGTYDISVEYISYKTKNYPDKTINKSINLGTVSLSLDVESLGEVEIIAERTTVEIKLDKKIYNVGKDLTVRGGTVSDVLDNVPSVSVDVEGNVALRGNEDVRILINGKPSGLVGLNSTDALRQLPAESIEKVEVITSPSARYDAEGTAGILNIILRRSKLTGLNGAITTNVGYNPAAGISGNINYRTGDFNFFNTSGYSYREIPGNSFTDTQRFNIENGVDNPDNFIEEDRSFDRIRKGFNTNFGVEWYVNETASLTTSLFYRNSDNESNSKNIVSTFDENRILTDEYTRREPELEDDKTIQYSLNFDKQFNGDSQHKFTADFQYEDSTEDEGAPIFQDDFQTESVRTVEHQDRILLQTDYVYPISETGQFEIGYRGNFNTLDTDYTLETLNDDNELTLNTDQSNILNYKEYINAFYSQYGNKIGKKFSYLFGLRVEDTRITIDQQTSNDLAKKQYTELFPTANFSYEISDEQSLTLGFNRRIRRPRSRFINPFPSRSSSTSLFQGNPDINPSFSNTFDLGYLIKIGKFTLSSSVYYKRDTDIFQFISEGTDNYYNFDTNQTITNTDPDFQTQFENDNVVQVVKRTPINLSSQDNYGGEFTLSYRPTRKWNLNANFNIFKYKTEGVFNDVDYGAESVSWFARLNNKYTLPGKIEWQTRLNYRGPFENSQNEYNGIFSSDMAFSKDLFNDKASISFRVSDILNSRKREIDTQTDSFNSYSEFQFRQRSFNLAFTYRFNQKKKRERSGRGNGGDFDFEG